MPSTSKITPEAVRPYPTPSIQKKKRSVNRKGQSRIYTDTPEKDRLEAIENLKADRKKKQEERKKKKVMKVLFAEENKPTKARKVQKHSSTDSSDSEVSIELASDDDLSEGFSDDEANNQFLLTEDDNININNYILVKFPTKARERFFVGKVTRVVSQQEFEVTFLRCKSSIHKFYYPTVSDESIVDRPDIIAKLPDPMSSKTARTSSLLSFNFNFSKYNIQ